MAQTSKKKKVTQNVFGVSVQLFYERFLSLSKIW